jgi:Trypsin-co-occurring domain 1
VRGLIDFPLEDGGSVLVEADDLADGPALRGRTSAPSIGEASETLETALGQLAPATRAVLAQLRTLADAPESIEVEFGIRLSAEAQVIIARGSAEANFRVVLRWSSAGAGG